MNSGTNAYGIYLRRKSALALSRTRGIVLPHPTKNKDLRSDTCTLPPHCLKRRMAVRITQGTAC